MVGEYYRIMNKYIPKTKEGLSIEGQKKTDKLVEDLGQIGLGQSMEFAKAIIENYFLNEKLSTPIIELINKNIEIQRVAESYKNGRN